MSARAVVTSFIDALNAHDAAGAIALLDGTVETDVPPLGIRAGGLSEAEAFVADLLRAFPDLRVAVRRTVVLDDAVVLEVKVEGTQADGYLGAINQEKHLDVDQAWRLVVTDGAITAFEAYWCHQQLLRRLGVKRFDRVALV